MNGCLFTREIKSMYVNSLACFRVKGEGSEWFRIHIGVYHVLLAFQYIYMDTVMKEVKMGIGRRGVRFLEEEME